jgi:DDE family transposase
MRSSRISKKDTQAVAAGNVKRWSLDCKATVQLGEFSRGGLTRGEIKACDHDLGCQAKYIPCGVVDEATGQLSITFGSSAKTSDFIVDVLAARWYALSAHEQRATAQLQLKMDNGPESSGMRTQFLHRMVQFADQIGKPIQLLYFPPYHSKYNPIERCWGILELHWNGTLLREVDTMLAWAQSMTWKGRSPVVELNHKEYPRGVTLRKKAMRTVECRLERHPELPKWDILIRPAAPD